VLDRLLEEDWLAFDGISGTSAGAMNATVVASGYHLGGIDGAKAAPETFWKAVSDAARFSPLQRGPLALWLGRWTLEDSLAYGQRGGIARVLALRPEPDERPSAARHPGRDGGLRLPGQGADAAVPHRHQRAHRHRPRLPQCRHDARRAAGPGLPADMF
jgi:hypothetical protein